MASVRGTSVLDDSDSRSIKSSFQQILTTFPKNISKKNLKDLYRFLLQNDLDDDSYEEEGISALIAVIFLKSSNILERVLACGCLHQLSPQPDLCQTFSEGDISHLVLSLPMLLLQRHHDSGFQKIVQRLISYLETIDKDFRHHPKILSFFSHLVSDSNWYLSLDDLRRLSACFPTWLRYLPQQSVPSKTHFRKADMSAIVTELDGSPSTEIFTVLSAVEKQSLEQQTSVHTFSLLRSLLLRGSSTAGCQDLCHESSLLITDQLSNAIRNYCLRILEQAERTPQVTSDLEFQKACLVEAVNLLNLQCQANPNHVPPVLPSIRVLYDRNILKQPTAKNVAVLVAAAQFLIRHGGVIMHKMADICPYLLKDITALCYHDDWAAYEVISFVREYLAHLCYHSSVLEKFFPSLFKILAWNPVAFESDFLTILPACISSQTAVEMFHALLDLPCLSASLILQRHLDSTGSFQGMDSAVSQLVSEPAYQGMFSFVLRPVSGMGDTFNRVQAFHTAIESLSRHPRVVACANTVIPLLKCYFEVFMQFADTSLTSLLLPAVLERISIIYAVPEFPEKVNSILSEVLLDLVQDHPDICTHLLEEISSYINEQKNANTAPEFYINLVWAVGEYASITYSAICRPEVVTCYYEGLECVVYELLPTCIQSQTVRLMCVAITTLAKLSTGCQDLLPRALLCLGKVGLQAVTCQSPEHQILITRIKELMALLRVPSLASQVLNPPKEILSGKWHRDVTSFPYNLKIVTTLAGGES